VILSRSVCLAACVCLLVMWIQNPVSLRAQGPLSSKQPTSGPEKPECEKSPRDELEGEMLPTGMSITPRAAKGSIFQGLNPDLPGLPPFTV